MSKTAPNKIVILGCGNVAWHLAKQLTSLKKYTLFIYNHKRNPALNAFKSELQCNIQANFDNIITDADLYFICVSDKFISAAASKLNNIKKDALIIHTSGSAPLKEIKNANAGTGVFYPLQTFSKNDVLVWKEIPVILEAKNAATKSKLVAFAKQLTDKAVILGGKERLRLHLAAVLVNNFTNALYVAASQLLGENTEANDFKILLPLIRQTTKKIERLDPVKAQTGPAKRNDKIVFKKHLRLLAKQKEMRKLYEQFNILIAKQQHTHA